MKNKLFIRGMIALLCVAALTLGVAGAVAGIRASEDGIAVREDIPTVRSIRFSQDEEFDVTYSKSRSVKDGLADIYKDEKGNDYIYKDGELTGFYSNEINQPATDAVPIGREEAVRIAAAELEKFSDSADEYELRSFTEKENYGQYYITLSRKIGEIFTEEGASISVMYDGGVKSVSTFNDGEFEDVSDELVEGITNENLCKYAQDELELVYPGEGELFEMSYSRLEADGDGYYVAIYGELNGSSEVVRYELDD